MKKVFISLIGLFLTVLLSNEVLHIVNYKNQQYIWGWANEATRDAGLNKPLFLLDKELIYVPNKNVFSLPDKTLLYDSLGFRPTGAKYSGPDAIDIVVLGDSFTYGFLLDLNETLPYLLERYLRNLGWKTNVYNAGVNGYGSDQQFLYLKKRILNSVQPDIVIWNININDLEDNNSACLFKKTRNGFEHVPAWLNTSYIQGRLIQILPDRIVDSRLGNVILHGIAPGWSRHTIGCTRKIPPEGQYDHLQDEKIVYLLEQFSELSIKYRFKLYLSLAPSQFYIDKSYPHDHFMVKMYQNLKSTLEKSGMPLLDTNSVLVSLISSVAYQGRFTGNIVQNLRGVLGTTVSNIDISLEKLFIDEGELARGNWHPTAVTNSIIADYYAHTLTL